MVWEGQVKILLHCWHWHMTHQYLRIEMMTQWHITHTFMHSLPVTNGSDHMFTFMTNRGMNGPHYLITFLFLSLFAKQNVVFRMTWKVKQYSTPNTACNSVIDLLFLLVSVNTTHTNSNYYKYMKTKLLPLYTTADLLWTKCFAQQLFNSKMV